MKKVLICILMLLMLTVSACGKEEAGPASGAEVSGGGEGTKATAATTGQEKREMELLGTQEGNTYRNPDLGLTCVLPEGFTFSTMQKLLETNGLNAKAELETLYTMAANGQPVQVMYALDSAGRRNIMVTFQQATGEELGEKDVKGDLQAQLDGDIRAAEAMGLTNVRGEYTLLTVDGKELDTLILSGNSGEQKILSITVQYKIGNGLVTLTLNGPDRNALDQILAGMTLS